MVWSSCKLVLVAWLVFSAAAVHAQTNDASTNASTVMQIWDVADELGFTPEQRKEIETIRDQYEAARAAVRRAAAADTPPDAQRAAQLNLNDQFRLTNRRLSELLTDEQKEKFSELRRAAATSARARRASARAETNNVSPATDASATATTGGGAGDSDFEAPPMASTRKPPRPQLTDEEYRKLALELRAAYAKPSTNWPAPTIDDEAKPHYVELGLLPLVVFPTNNPYSAAKAELGKKLFFDPRLSGPGQMACASCHDADLGFTDGRTVSFGHERKELKRNAPMVLNVAFSKSLFWDGRADSLEQQVIDVVNNQDEMHSGPSHVVERLNKIPGYTNEFAEVFGTPEVTLSRTAMAIATFERTITSRGNNFDSFLRGDTNALNDSAVRGLHLFRTTARCANCHNGPNFTDERFHNEGLSYYGRKLQDLGRYEITKRPEDVGAFKTPSLRNIGRTAPYMHNGLFDLDGVLNMYNAGMATLRRKPSQKDDPLFPTKSPLLQSLGLNRQDIADLKAFLETLTETRLRMRPPELAAEAPAVP